MKITIQRGQINTALNSVSKAIRSNTVIPITQCVKIDVQSDKTILTGTNMDVEMSATIETTNVETGAFCINFVKLSNLIKNLAEQPLTFDVSDTLATIKSSSGKYQIPVENAKDFPVMKLKGKPETFSIDSAVIQQAIDAVAFNASIDYTGRPAMCGVHVELGDGVKFTATDSNRLGHFNTGINAGKGKVTLTNNIVRSLPVSDGNVDVSITPDKIQFNYDGLTVTGLLLDSIYPNYEAVIPKDNPYTMKVNRMELNAAIRRVAGFSNVNGLIKLSINGGVLLVMADNADLSEEGEDAVTAEWNGPDFIIGLSKEYLSEALDSLDCAVVNMTFAAPNKAGLLFDELTPENYQLLMPMIIK